MAAETLPPDAAGPEGGAPALAGYDARVLFWFSKAIEPFLTPLAWALLLAAAGALLRRRRAGPFLLWGAALVLVAFSSDQVADRLMAAVERSAPLTYRPDVVYDAAIVLGGMVDADASRVTGEAEMNDAVDRVLRGFELWRAGRTRHVLLSGGLVYPQPGDVAEADRLAAALARWGVPPDRIAVERSSRNTRENAIESAKLAAARGWRTLLLVTSAAHAPRALAAFRAVGLAPDVLPVDRRAGDGRARGWLPSVEALGKSTQALRELFGRLAYRAAGYGG